MATSKMDTAIPQSVTFWLDRWSAGDDEALEQVTKLVYHDLRRLAQRYLQSEDPGHTLQATALVHEFYLRISSWQNVDWKGRGQFIGIAARTMRRILIDHARKRQAAKRDSGQQRALPGHTTAPGPDVLDVDRALEKLAADYPRHAQIVELRFFGGLHAPEIAKVLDLSLSTVERDWRFAKAWLQNEVAGF
jgi:RNA polymerase sigma factor (TIGR02999 family)